MGDEPFVQPHLSALAPSAVRDLQVELTLPVRVQLRLQVIEQPIPPHGASPPSCPDLITPCRAASCPPSPVPNRGKCWQTHVNCTNLPPTTTLEPDDSKAKEQVCRFVTVTGWRAPSRRSPWPAPVSVSYTHLRAHETGRN